jgi:chromosomal replication initiation ATPase DnaA
MNVDTAQDAHLKRQRVRILQLQKQMQSCLRDLAQLAQELIVDSEVNWRAREVLQCVAAEFSMTPAQVCTRTQQQETVIPRQIVQYVLRDGLSLSYAAIAKETGVSDHTTVIHGCQKIEKLMRANPEFEGRVRKLIGKCMDNERVA